MDVVMGDEMNLVIECEYTEWGVKIHYSDMTLNDDNYLEFIDVTGRYNNKLDEKLMLVDARKIIRRVSISKLYEIVTVYGATTDVSCIGRRLAILSSEETDAEGSEFISDVCANRGLQVNFFFDQDEALAWLLKDA